MTALAPSDAQDAAQRAAGRGGSAVTGPAPALAARPSRTPVSAEFTGRARALLGRFQAYERVYRDSLQAAFEPLKRRLRQGHKVQRTEDLAACERQLDSMPKFGLLHAERDFNRSRRTLDIWQLRIATVYSANSRGQRRITNLRCWSLRSQCRPRKDTARCTSMCWSVFACTPWRDGFSAAWPLTKPACSQT